MHVIPVIDVRNGVAVAAIMGDRSNYQPLVTPLSYSADPLAIARGYLTLYPFATLYLADLDGIERRGADLDLVRRLTGALPEVTFWIDNGAADAASVGEQLAIDRVVAVVGSESGIEPGDLDALRSRYSDRLVLSLDFKGDRFLGAPRLLHERGTWPARVIAMTLASVGTANGPEVARLGEVTALAGLRRVYCAGGIRNRADLKSAAEAGASGALVATALHTGQIKAGDLEEIAGW
ncbi:MAG: HisA/HisF-related TIM barrel protein [Hyphomicrobium sp.]